MNPQTTTTQTGGYEDHISGYATTTDRQVLHITATVAGEVRRYILPRQEFDRYALGNMVMGYSRDALNEGEGDEVARSIRFEWIAGHPVLVDLLNDPLEEYKVWLDPKGFADLWTLNRRVCFASGLEVLKNDGRVVDELDSIVRKEVEGGYV